MSSARSLPAAASRRRTTEQAIAREERLIEIYETELVSLQQRNGEQQQQLIAERCDDENDASLSDTDEDDPLDWMMRQQNAMDKSQMSALLASLTSPENDKAAHSSSAQQHRLQPAIRNFCFTSVHRNPTEIITTTTTTTTVSQYCLRGYFLANPSIRARIDVALQAVLDDNNNNNTDKMALKTTRIQSMKYHLHVASSDDNDNTTTTDWTWLEREVKARQQVYPHNNLMLLAGWMDAVSRYLEFHNQRLQFLKKLHSTTAIQHQTTHGSKVVLRINNNMASSSSRGGLELLSLVWGWKWKEGRDVLRLTQESFGLRQSHLDALVQVCGGRCEDALELLLQQLQPDTEKEEVAAEDADDEESVHGGEEDPARNDKSTAGAKKRRRPVDSPEVADSDEGSDVDEGADDSSAGSALNEKLPSHKGKFQQRQSSKR